MAKRGRGERGRGVCKGCGHYSRLDEFGAFCTRCHREGRATNSKTVFRIRELLAPQRKKTRAEREADDVAAEKMRSRKGNNWRLGKSPSDYG